MIKKIKLALLRLSLLCAISIVLCVQKMTFKNFIISLALVYKSFSTDIGHSELRLSEIVHKYVSKTTESLNPIIEQKNPILIANKAAFFRSQSERFFPCTQTQKAPN